MNSVMLIGNRAYGKMEVEDEVNMLYFIPFQTSTVLWLDLPIFHAWKKPAFTYSSQAVLHHTRLKIIITKLTRCYHSNLTNCLGCMSTSISASPLPPNPAFIIFQTYDLYQLLVCNYVLRTASERTHPTFVIVICVWVLKVSYLSIFYVD